jgi:RimJ/RimL family protein N-acetyltransferase
MVLTFIKSKAIKCVMDIPIIETDRLIMRGHKMDDFTASATMWAQPEVVRYISGKPSTREESFARLLRYAGHWQLRGYGYWLVEEKTGGAFVGEVGFGDFMREMTPSIEGMMEAGWVLSPDQHGKGYATEAVKAAIGWARTFFPTLPITCILDQVNKPSFHVAEKCGFKQRLMGDYKGEKVLVMDHH